METHVRQPDDLANPPQSRRLQSTDPRQQAASPARRFGGMHLRRDKRFPFARQGNIEVPPPLPQRAATIQPVEIDTLKQWKEAVMLWLSWNSAQEKLTEKMCKPGIDQRKLEALMDEMDEFRKRAIELSERLLRE